MCQFALNSDPCFAFKNDPFASGVEKRPEAMRGAGRRSATQRRRAPVGMGDQLRFLKRQLVLPVSMISQ